MTLNLRLSSFVFGSLAVCVYMARRFLVRRYYVRCNIVYCVLIYACLPGGRG